MISARLGGAPFFFISVSFDLPQNPLRADRQYCLRAKPFTGEYQMWPTRDDFRIKASNFDLTNGFNILRIICGLFLFPHVMGKFAAGAVSAGTAGFFAKAGFHPPEVWVWIAAVAETSAGVALVLGIGTRYAALGACALLAIAVYSLQVVKGFGWTWNTGGYEYPVFWAITSLALAIEAWKAQFARAVVPVRSHLKIAA
jgi:putative oxidoreductase